MEFNVGDTLQVDGDIYDVLGKIYYVNEADAQGWYEYRIFARGYRTEKWLSIDNVYHEYSISEIQTGEVNLLPYHEVDSGKLRAVSVDGSVDVEVGDTAIFIEYEDHSEEEIVSVEKWEDGTEYSKGYYLDANEIKRVSAGAGNSQNNYNVSFNEAKNKVSNSNLLVSIIVIILVVFTSLAYIANEHGFNIFSRHPLDDYFSKSGLYTYVTSITGNKNDKANVYSTSLSIDQASKNIIDEIEGNVEQVQQNTEDQDHSIAILTKKEYCIVYTGSDQLTYVQVSNRKYAYYNDQEQYRANRAVHRFYRRFYFSGAYPFDASRFRSKKGQSPYVGFDDSAIQSNPYDTYSSYSNSVRQESINARDSDGGGIGYGK